MKIQLDVPEEVHRQLLILKSFRGFKTLPETVNYVLKSSVDELVKTEGKILYDK